MLRKTWIFLIMWFLLAFVMPYSVLAQDLEVDGFNIMPELTDAEIGQINTEIKDIWSVWWHVRENYNEAADRMWESGHTGAQIASWIMNWDTLLNYLVFVVQFLGQLWLVVGVVFIMYAGYGYMLSVFKGWKVPTETVKNAIIWVIIVIFSYAIMKTLTSFIGLS